MFPISGLFSKSVRRKANVSNDIIKNPLVPYTIGLSDLLSENLQVMVGPLRTHNFNTTEYELLCVSAIVKSAKVSRAFEIGTFDGRTTRSIASNLEPGGRVETINLAPGQDTNDEGVRDIDSMLNVEVKSGERFIGTLEGESITQLYGDSASFDFSPYHGQYDLVFIDGAHSYPYVKNDTEVARKLLKPEGGIIIWHDAPLYGVVPHLLHLIKKEKWPIELISGSTLAVVYYQDGKPLSLSEKMPSLWT